jgi:hypothetical protein
MNTDIESNGPYTHLSALFGIWPEAAAIKDKSLSFPVLSLRRQPHAIEVYIQSPQVPGSDEDRTIGVD